MSGRQALTRLPGLAHRIEATCPACHLVLDGYELVIAAGLAEDFPDVGDPADHADDDYNND